MNLAEFHSLVSGELKRGSTLDSLIPKRVALAVGFLERNYPMQYMSRFMEITLAPSDPNSRQVQLPGDLKSVRFLRTVDSVGDYQTLTPIDPRDLRRLEIGMPGGYWLVGRDMLVLDKTPDAAYKLDGEVKMFTDWPVDTKATHWLLQRAPDLLLAQTMVYFGNYLRDVGMVTQYRGMRDESLRTVMLDDEEIKHDGMDAAFSYAPRYGL